MGLLAAAADFGAGLLRLGARTAGRHVGVDHLEYQGLVVFAAEVLVRHREFSPAIGNFELHGHHFLLGVLAAAFGAGGLAPGAALAGAAFRGAITLRAESRAAFTEGRTM